MNMTDYLSERLIYLDSTFASKQELIQRGVDILHDECDSITNPEVFKRAILHRESIVSTGIGEGVAIPHAKTDAVDNITIGFFRLQQAVEYDAIDEKPVDIVFIIGIPPTDVPTYLNLLAKLTYNLRSASRINSLRTASDQKEVLEIIRTMYQ